MDEGDAKKNPQPILPLHENVRGSAYYSDNNKNEANHNLPHTETEGETNDAQ